jgi:hypothetical protein
LSALSDQDVAATHEKGVVAARRVLTSLSNSPTKDT